ncbi:MAG: AraC family transcriptional regulator [Lachnospiraceae bacterium]|nr:AraC family transcriptional regulator [Lachnospiraceae bacterium]
MYKLLIIDDEPLVLAGIRSMVRWEDLQIEICGAASNGSQGWDIMMREMPDIILTDIKMPVMSGLELLKKTRDFYQNNNYPVFVLLTSYEDFHMAKEAITYHAVDYLIKLELTADSLKKCIQRITETLDKNGGTAEHRPPDLSLKEIQSLKDKFFIRLLHNLYDSEQQFEILRHDLNIPFESACYQCCYFELNNADADKMSIEKQVALYTASYQLLQDIASKYIRAYFVNLDKKHGAVIILLDDTPTDGTDLIQIIKQTGNSLYNYYKTRLKCGIGIKVNTPLSLSDSYQTARASFSNIIDNDSAVLVADTSVITSETPNIFNISIFKEDLNCAFSEYDSALLTDVLTQMAELLEENPDHYIQSLDAACNVLFLSISLLPDGEEVVSSLFTDYNDGYRSIYHMNTTEQVAQWLRIFCKRLSSYFEEQKKRHRHHVVENVKKYIASHLSDKLTLNEVAAIYGISPNYLSTLFKKYNDCGFSEYITECKIAQAKKMMNEGNQKIYEIADTLGFESAFYFSKVFKKLEGISPSEYINKI